MNIFLKIFIIFKNEGLKSLLERSISFFIRNTFLDSHFNKEVESKKLIEQLTSMKIYKTNLSLTRIGPKNDSGYLLPENLDDIDYCISPGVGDAFEFEINLKKKWNIQSLLIDGTLKKSLEDKIRNLNEFKFINKNLSNKDTKNQISFSTILKSFENKKLMLQMDIEGSEYNILNNISESHLKRFNYIVIEFHDFDQIKKNLLNKKIFGIIDKINKYFTLIHIHPNNCCDVFKVSSINIPNVFEATYVNNSLINFKKLEKLNFPHPEDSPNLSYKKEILLDNFFYNGKSN